MGISGFLDRLFEIRRAFSVRDAPTVQHLVADAPDYMADLQKRNVNNAPGELRAPNVPD